MPRKSVEEFYKKIFSYVNSTPKTVSEISNEAGTSWESTRKVLELFESMGIINSTEIEGKKHYFRPTSEKETYFNIPLSKDDENLINFIFEKIKEAWKKEVKSIPGKTVVQKILVRVNIKCNLGLPVGRYLYGMICPKPFDSEKIYEFSVPLNSSAITDEINRAVKEYSRLPTREEVKRKHYEETQNELYKLKENVFHLIMHAYSKESIDTIIHQLLQMVVYLPHDKEILESFLKYVDFINRLKTKIDDLHTEIVGTFEKLWTFIATKIFYLDMLSTGKYVKEQLIDLKRAADLHKLILNDHFASLDESLPKVEPSPEEIEKLKSLKGSVKETEFRELSEEERRKLAEELVKDKHSNLFREFDLN